MEKKASLLTDSLLGTKRQDAVLVESLSSESREGEAILILDLGGRILSVNEESEYLFGRAGEGLIGQTLDSIITAARGVSLTEHLNTCIRGERVRNVAALRHMSNRDTFPVTLTLSLLANEEGEPIRIVTIARDVGTLRQRLAREGRLITAGELAAGLAHELNQPLSAITHYCDAATSIAVSATQVDEELIDVLREAAGQARRAAEILRNLREMLARRKIEHTQENLNAIIEETTKFLVPEMRINQVMLTLSLTKNMPQLKLIRVQIQQVIVNLILNSIEAMKTAGGATRRVSIASTYNHTEVKVSINDTGPGIDPVIASRLFDPFQTNREEGLGLGLPICQSIVAAHNGRIWADPPGGAGATFHFVLPRNQGD